MPGACTCRTDSSISELRHRASSLLYCRNLMGPQACRECNKNQPRRPNVFRSNVQPRSATNCCHSYNVITPSPGWLGGGQLLHCNNIALRTAYFFRWCSVFLRGVNPMTNSRCSVGCFAEAAADEEKYYVVRCLCISRSSRLSEMTNPACTYCAPTVAPTLWRILQRCLGPKMCQHAVQSSNQDISHHAATSKCTAIDSTT